MRHASDSIWSEQEDRAKTSTRNSGAQAAGRLPLNRLRRGTTSRKASANMDLMSSQRQEQPEGDESDLARLPLFPIEDHLVQLLRAGRIKSLGKRPSERRHQELSAADWMGLEIAELVGLSVAKSEATCLFVMLSQPDVLREFPALPIEPKSPSTETARPDDSSARRNRGERGDTDPSGGREICAAQEPNHLAHRAPPAGRRRRISRRRSS